MVAAFAKPLLDADVRSISQQSMGSDETEKPDSSGQRVPSKGVDCKAGRWSLLLMKMVPVLPILTLAMLAFAVFIVGSATAVAQDLRAVDYLGDSRRSTAFGCDANGNMWIAAVHKPSDWDAVYALSVTLGFGRLSYTHAKAVDVVWDLVFGRTSQALMIALVYRLYRRVIVGALETRTISFDQLIGLQYSTCTFSALLAYVKELDMRWFWRRRSTINFLTGVTLVLCTIYAMVLPTWLSTMTGYQAIATPVLVTGDGASVFPNDLQTCAYTIGDGNRIGYWPAVCATTVSPLGKALLNYTTVYPVNDTVTDRAALWIPSDLVLPGEIYHLGPPLLNITIYDQFRDPVYSYGNATFSVEELHTKGTCQPEVPSKYQWGFSITLLFG